jgi:hypothetical protein
LALSAFLIPKGAIIRVVSGGGSVVLVDEAAELVAAADLADG